MKPHVAAVFTLLLAPVARAAEGGPVATTFSIDDATKLTVSGYVQADTVFTDQASLDEQDPATGAPLNDIRFSIRRAELFVDGAHDLKFLVVSASVELLGSTLHGPALGLQRAEALVAWPGARPIMTGAVGIMKIPFGVEIAEEVPERLFLEESETTRALFPGDVDVGMRLRGEWTFLRYSLAAMNGNPLGDPSYPLVDPNHDKDVVGRVGVDAEIVDGVRLRAGVSGLAGRGSHAGERPAKDTLIWRDLNEDGLVQASELTSVTASVGVPSESFPHSAIGGDVRVQWDAPILGTLSVDGDMTFASNLDRGFETSDPIVIGHDVRNFGWRVAISQEITPYVVLGVRYDEYNPDLDALDVRAGRANLTDATIATLAFAAAVQWPHVARLLLEYDHQDNALGLDTAGIPTTLAADRFTTRAQVQF